MPIKRILWDGNSGRDIHVLRGSVSRNLTHLALQFVEDNVAGTMRFADDYLNQFGDVTLTFKPLFKGTTQGNEFVGHQNGIIVNQRTGVVTIAPAIGINVKHNFIIEVEARNNGDGRTFRQTIRVHVHGAVTQVWLTPDQLTVRPILGPGESIETFYRFAVRAQFDDGLVGDLTDGHGVTWAPGDHVGPTGRILILPTDQPGDVFPVTATLPAQLGGASTPAGPRIRVASSFRAQATPPQMTLVAGGGPVSADTVQDTLNVLLLSEGFRLEDQGSFDRIIDGFVHHLRTNQLTKPFNLLSRKMNFWKLFIPNEQLGSSICSEVATIGIHPHAKPIPAVRKPPEDPPAPEPPAKWGLSNLLYAVGLPVHGDDSPARTPAFLKDEWRELLSADPSPHITDELVMEWKKLARRTLVEEVDGFPGLSMGFPPAASNGDPTLLGLHPSRVGVGRSLRMYCETLGSASAALPDGRPVGTLWRESGNATAATTNSDGYAVGARTITLAAAGTGRFRSGDTVAFAGDPNRYVLEEGTAGEVSSGGTIELVAPGLLTELQALAVPVAVAPRRFRSGDFLVIVSPLRAGRAVNWPFSSGLFVAMGVGASEVFPVRAMPGKNAVVLDVPNPSADIDSSVSRTLAHELGHSMGLGDEYWEFHEPFRQTGSQTFANLQRELDTQIQDPADPTKRIIHGDQIQWNWHRIVKAAVVSGDIAPGGPLDEFRIPVMPDVAFRFALGDKLRLRPRVWGQPLRKLGLSEISDELVVVAPPESDAVLVRSIHAISPQTFPPGSLLYLPRPAPASVASPAYPYAEMVAKNIKDSITASKRALRDFPADNKDPESPLVDGENGRTAVVHFDLDDDEKNLPRVVGLYPGGARFTSGIFHPAGLCMMRHSKNTHAEFCAVCRYVMVDLIAPEFHEEIDAEYERAYPQK